VSNLSFKLPSHSDPTMHGCSFTYVLPLEDDKTGETYRWGTFTKGGFGEVQRLSKLYAKRLKRAQRGLPIAELSADGYQNHTYKRWVDTPYFDILRFTEEQAPPRHPVPGMSR
jgi:hypothetical protein